MTPAVVTPAEGAASAPAQAHAAPAPAAVIAVAAPAAPADAADGLATMQRRLDRERAARKAAEALLTDKSRELWDALQRTPLHRLCESKLRDATMFVEQLEVMLADPRVDLKAEDHLGRKPLHVLCMNVYAPVLAINRLMDRTPLGTLTHADHIVMPDGSILPAAAAASSPVRPTSGGRTPLHYLAENVALAQDTMYSSVVNLFSAKLAAGDLARGDAAKDTPLHIACRVNASMTLVSFLLEHCKCPPGGCTPVCAVALRNGEDLQPLHVACLNKAASVELITQLLARRADLVNSPAASNFTALHYACMGSPRAEFLRPEDEGLPPRRIQYSKVEVISALLRRGALVETPPAEDTRCNGPSLAGANTISPFSFQVPPRPCGASQRMTAGPPPIAIFLIFPLAKNPTVLLSGDQKG